jgi:hypothetical protein
MLKSVPYLAALLPAVLLICLSAHADTQVNTIQAMPNVSVLSDAAANFRVPQKLDAWIRAQPFGTKPAEFSGSMQYFNDRTRFRSLCPLQGRQSYAAVDRPRQRVAARQ